MGLSRQLPDDTVDVMDALLAGDLVPWQRTRAEGLRLLARGRTNADVASILAKHPNTVCMWRSQYLQRGIASITTKTKGGRRNQLMDEESERAFIESFAAAADRGELVTVSQIHDAIVDKTGQAPWASTIYKMLRRHGWRKITPRPTHPDADPARREAFKQTSQAWSPPPAKASISRSA